MRPLVAALCVWSFTVLAPVPKERADAEKIVGTWKLVRSTSPNTPNLNVGLEMELAASGKLTLRQSVNNGPVQIYEGEYKVNKNELPYSVNYPGGGRKSETLTIKKLTETELVVVDPDGIQEEFERVKPKKMEEPEKK